MYEAKAFMVEVDKKFDVRDSRRGSHGILHMFELSYLLDLSGCIYVVVKETFYVASHAQFS